MTDAELTAHLTGPLHGLDPALLVPSTTDDITQGRDSFRVRYPALGEWLSSLHVTNHGCPYPPAIAHAR